MLLDTNALSAFAERDQDLLRILPTDRPWFLPVIAVGEYRFGLKSSTKGREREAWLAGLIDVVTVLPVNESTTLHYATVRQELKLANRQIPPNHSWIAALALEKDLPVVSRDTHFDFVPGVRRIGW